jgi:L-lactate permease
VVAYRKDVAGAGRKLTQPYALTWERITHIAIPLFGALALVSLIRQAPESPQSPAYIIGYNLSEALSAGWLAINTFIGALGSFFSGNSRRSHCSLSFAFAY